MRNKFKPRQFKPVMFSVSDDKSSIIAKIDCQLEVERPIYPFSFVMKDENAALLLQERFNNVMSEHEKKIARDCLSYLEPEEISGLKRRLKNWHGSKNCWFK